jgi:hypothetical protein
MGQQLELVGGVEGDHAVARPAPTEEISKTPIGEYAFDEVLAQLCIVEAPLVLDGEIRVRLHQSRRIKAPPLSRRHALFLVDLHAGHSTARRVLL